MWFTKGQVRTQYQLACSFHGTRDLISCSWWLCLRKRSGTSRTRTWVSIAPAFDAADELLQKYKDATNLPMSACDFYNVHSRNGIAHFRYKIEVLPWAVRWRLRISTFLNLYTLYIDYLGQPGWLTYPLLCIVVYLRYILYIILRLYSSRPCVMHWVLNYYQLSVIDQTLSRVHLK